MIVIGSTTVLEIFLHTLSAISIDCWLYLMNEPAIIDMMNRRTNKGLPLYTINDKPHSTFSIRTIRGATVAACSLVAIIFFIYLTGVYVSGGTILGNYYTNNANEIRSSDNKPIELIGDNKVMPPAELVNPMNPQETLKTITHRVYFDVYVYMMYLYSIPHTFG